MQKDHNDYKALIHLLIEVQVPAGLNDQITARIRKEVVRIARIRVAFFGLAAFVSCVTAGFALSELITRLHQSGLYDYASLIFSDSGALVTYWKTFALSFIEALPILTLSFFLAASAIFLWTLAKALNNINTKHIYGYN
jgi:hypothetical protein